MDLYYGPDRGNRPDEGYALYADTISGRGRPRIVPLAFQFPNAADCVRANRAAVFHAGIHGGLPCLEVDGILVFAYLDAQVGAVRVSVHLDSAPDHLVRPMTRFRCGSRSRTRSCSMTATRKAHPGRRCWRLC